MSDPWLPHGYEIVLTEDGSPSLRWLASETQETMHHRGGAYSETQLIYGNVVRETFAKPNQPAELAFLSVGLGLGYNEILVAVEALKTGYVAKTFLRSYEKDKFLVQQFLNWLESGVQQPTQQVYEQILGFFSMDRVKVADVLLGWLNNQQWQILGSLERDFVKDQRFHCILYDAFSSKTSPFLWQEDFLQELLNDLAHEQCLISTYACTGPLKRALRATGFQVVLRDGFASKRNSTLGVRPSRNL